MIIFFMVKKIVTKAVTIGDAVWVGAGVNILSGISIGDGGILGMGSVITKDVPKGAIVIGNPAEIVNYRGIERFDNLYVQNLFLRIWQCSTVI
jgi:maltose O-acetyltransferase